jgi:hypothetical protein
MGLPFATGLNYKNFSQNMIELNFLKCIKMNSKRANCRKARTQSKGAKVQMHDDSLAAMFERALILPFVAGFFISRLKR